MLEKGVAVSGGRMTFGGAHVGITFGKMTVLIGFSGGLRGADAIHNNFVICEKRARYSDV